MKFVRVLDFKDSISHIQIFHYEMESSSREAAKRDQRDRREKTRGLQVL